MGIVFRQSAKNLIIVAFGAVLGALVMWLSTKYITKQGLGFNRSVVVNSTIISQLLLIGLNSTLFVYIQRFAGEHKKTKVLITLSLIIPGILAILFTVGYFLLRERILHHFQQGDVAFIAEYFIWIPLSVFSFIYMTILEQYLGSQMKVAVSAFMREVLLRIINIAMIVLFAFGYISFHTLMVFSILMFIIPTAIFFLLAAKTEPFGISFRLKDLSVKEYKELGSFAWYHFLLSAALILLSMMDSLLLPFYDHSGFSSAAIYAVASFMLSFLLMPSKAFLPASFTALARAFAQENMEEAKDIFSRASLNVMIPTVFIAVLLCCNVSNVVAVIGDGKNYSAVTSVFMILMIGSVINVSTGMNDQVLTIANYYKFNFYVSIFLIALMFVFLRLSIPRYGVYAAAFSNTIVLIIFNVIKFLFVWKKLDMQPFSSKTLKVVLAGIPALAAGYFFPHFFGTERHVYVHTFIDVALRSSVILIAYVLMLLWLKPSPDLSEYIASIKKNKRLF